jgi:copper(I)-binding protein
MSCLRSAGFGLALVCGALSSNAFAQTSHAGHAGGSTLAVSPAWTRATPPGSKVAGGFLTIENRSNAADRLISATVNVANIVEIHEMAVENGIMKMRALEKGLTIEPGSKRELKPGSYHIMFIDLKQQLKEGDTVTGDLVFEKAGKIPVTYKVMPVGAKSADAHQHH